MPPVRDGRHDCMDVIVGLSRLLLSIFSFPLLCGRYALDACRHISACACRIAMSPICLGQICRRMDKDNHRAAGVIHME